MKKFALLLLFPLVASAGITNPNLKVGQNTIAIDYDTKSLVVISCEAGNSLPPPSQPMPPPSQPMPPPAPMCTSNALDAKIQTARKHTDQMASGRCVRDWWVRHCNNELNSEPQLSEHRSFLLEEIRQAQREMETICSMASRGQCDYMTTTNARRNYHDFIRHVTTARNGPSNTPLVNERPETFRVSCD